MRTPRPDLEARLEDMVRACRGAGLAVTPQRVAVFRALCARRDHPSPEDLHETLRRSMPSLSLATVYKTLHRLRGLGVVEEVGVVGDNRRRFDGRVDRHHHLVCTRCRRVVDYDDPRYDAVPAPRRAEGFRPRAVTVQVFGTCAACAARD
jgi:Fur family peroxide stress response transcriptional regulator